MLVDSQWLLNRCPSQEISLSAFDPDAREIEPSAVMASALSRRFHSALKQLLDLQDRRKYQERAEMPDAVKIHKLYKMKGQPYHPAEFGFVLKNAQIDLYLRRTQAIDEANIAIAASALTCYPNKR